MGEAEKAPHRGDKGRDYSDATISQNVADQKEVRTGASGGNAILPPCGMDRISYEKRLLLFQA